MTGHRETKDRNIIKDAITEWCISEDFQSEDFTQFIRVKGNNKSVDIYYSGIPEKKKICTTGGHKRSYIYAIPALMIELGMFNYPKE